LGEGQALAGTVIGDDDVPGTVLGVGGVGLGAVYGVVFVILAGLVAQVLANGQTVERHPGQLDFAAIDVRLGHIGDFAQTAGDAVVLQPLNLLVLVVVVEQGAVQTQAAV